MKETAQLFLIPTPIGNLEDITLRALRLLREVDLILAEDTRTTIKLLKHYKIDKQLKSYHSFNEHKVLPQFLSILNEGKKIGLVTDAGTPGISDPGYLIVKACLAHNIDIECLPGPTAFIPALVKSGIPMDRFTFEGFLPPKKGRRKKLDELIHEKRTMIFYESPHRLMKTLMDISILFGKTRQASVSKELTKKFEETVCGELSFIIEHFKNKKLKGEFVLIVKGSD